MSYDKLILRQLNSPWVTDNTKNSVLSLLELDSNFIYLKGKMIHDIEIVDGNASLIDNYGDVVVTFPIGGGSGSVSGLTAGDVIVGSGATPNKGEIDFSSYGFNRFYTDLKIMAGQGLVTQDDGKYSLDLGTELVSPSITSSWVVYNATGGTIDTSTVKNLTVINGSVVDLINSQYVYPCSVGQPTSVSGDWGVNLNGCLPNLSSNISSAGLVSNTNWSVNLHKQSSGLVVVGNRVEFASGNDTKSDSTRVSFVNEVYHGSVNGGGGNFPPIPIESDISSGDTVYTNGDIALNNVTIPVDSGDNYYHHFVAYPASRGDLMILVIDGDSSFDINGVYVKNVLSFTNSVGLTEDYNVYVAIDSNAYTGNDLLFNY